MKISWNDVMESNDRSNTTGINLVSIFGGATFKTVIVFFSILFTLTGASLSRLRRIKLCEVTVSSLLRIVSIS